VVLAGVLHHRRERLLRRLRHVVSSYFPNRAVIEYVIWYPPQEEAAGVTRQIEQHVLDACRLDTWLALHSPTFGG
jgi:hypothetical protein